MLSLIISLQTLKISKDLYWKREIIMYKEDTINIESCKFVPAETSQLSAFNQYKTMVI